MRKGNVIMFNNLKVQGYESCKSLEWKVVEIHHSLKPPFKKTLHLESHNGGLVMKMRLEYEPRPIEDIIYSFDKPRTRLDYQIL
jgi:hypothetical protein